MKLQNKNKKDYTNKPLGRAWTRKIPTDNTNQCFKTRAILYLYAKFMLETPCPSLHLYMKRSPNLILHIRKRILAKIRLLMMFQFLGKIYLIKIVKALDATGTSIHSVIFNKFKVIPFIILNFIVLNGGEFS